MLEKLVGPGDVARSLFYYGLRKGAGPKVPLTLKGYFARGPHLPGFAFTLAKHWHEFNVRFWG